MNEPIPPAHDIPSGNTGPGLARNWIACGRRLVLEQKSLWFGMAAVYLFLGILLTLIPFMGRLLLILITPMLLAGVLWGRTQDNQMNPAPAPTTSFQTLFQTWIVQPAQELFCVFSSEEKTPPAVLLGIITLGLTILVMVAREWLVGGPMFTGLAASDFALQLLMFLKMFIVAVLYILLAMGLLYSVPLTVLGNRQPLDAISESFTTCRENARTILALVAPFFLVYVVILVAYAKSHWLGYLLTVSVGFLALPLFIAAVYCSYLTLFPPHPSNPRR